jgi:poly(3-hydroxybutyrate) depolymerase
MYDKGREGFLLGEIDYDTAVFKWLLVRLTAAGAPVFTSSQKFVSELVATHTIAGTSAALASKTGTDGIADAADMTPAFSGVPANAQNHVLVLIQASAVTGGADVANTLQRLVAWYDTGTNLPIVPTQGGDVNLTHDNGASKILKL